MFRKGSHVMGNGAGMDRPGLGHGLMADGERSDGSPMSADPVRKSLLLVDCDPAVSKSLEAAVRSVALAVCADFLSARARLLTSPPDWLVTNLRLGSYNGLH